MQHEAHKRSDLPTLRKMHSWRSSGAAAQGEKYSHILALYQVPDILRYYTSPPIKLKWDRRYRLDGLYENLKIQMPIFYLYHCKNCVGQDTMPTLSVQ